MNKAALLDSRGKVIGEIFDAPEHGNYITIAGAFDADDQPVNKREFKISRSKRNLAKAIEERTVYKKGDVYAYW